MLELCTHTIRVLRALHKKLNCCMNVSFSLHGNLVLSDLSLINFREKRKSEIMNEERERQKESKKKQHEEHENERLQKEEENRRKYAEWKERKRHEELLQASSQLSSTQALIQSRPPFKPLSRYK